MKTLIIYSHPQTLGFCSCILKNVERNLKDKNIEYEIIDLYKINYDAILRENEHYTSGNKKISELNKKIQQKIIETNRLIFIFPIWWGNMPAILKGFFDKILTPGFGFKYSKYGIPIKLLKNKKAVIITTSGGPKIYYIFTKNFIKHNVQKNILWLCGIKSKFYQIYSARKLNKKKEIHIETLLNKVLK